MSALVALGGAPAAANAADDCPNAAVRAQQGVQHLPNCMAYEKLTPNNKNGTIVSSEYLLSDDGTQAWVYANAPITEGAVSGNVQSLLATRGTDGWDLKPLTNNPLFGALRNMGPIDYLMLWGVQGMDRVLFQTNAPYDPGDVAGGAAMTTADYYIREPDGTYTWVTRPQDRTYAPQEAVGGAIDHVKASEDFSTIVFNSSRAFLPAVDPDENNHVWIWRDGKPYEMVDYMPNGVPSTTTSRSGTDTKWLTPDFKTVVWQTELRIPKVPRGTTIINHLFVRVGVGTPQARTLAVSETADGSISCSGNEKFYGVTLDGHYVRFSCDDQLTDDAPSTGGYYVKDTQTGEVIYDNPQVDRGPMTTDPAPSGWTRPDGTYHLGSRSGDLWTTNLLTGEESCATCSVWVDGKSPEASFTGGNNGLSAGGLGFTNRNYVTPEGDVFFTSPRQLVPEDRNAFTDLYLSTGGKVYLLSGGDAGENIQMGGVSLDGSTASFRTSSPLIAEDQDGGSSDVYVVRRNGGFYRAAQPAECASGCQGPAGAVNPLVAPLSLSFPATGDLIDESVDPVRVSGSRSVRGTSVKIKVRTPGEGRVTASGNGLRKTSRSVQSARTVTVTVRLSARSKRLLRKRSSVKRRVSVRFVPAEGKSQTKRVTVTFRKAKAKKRSKKKGSSRSVVAATSGKVAR